MIVDKDDIVTVEIIIDPGLTQIDTQPIFATGVITIEIASQDGARGRIEDTIRLYPVMSAELITAGFDITQGDSDLRRAILPTGRSAAWTWSIVAQKPGVHRITINVFGEIILDEESYIILESSTTRTVNVVDKPLPNRVVDGLLNNVPAIIGTGGPLGLIIAYMTYRMNQENKKRKETITELEKTIAGLEARIKELEVQSTKGGQPSPRTKKAA